MTIALTGFFISFVVSLSLCASFGVRDKNKKKKWQLVMDAKRCHIPLCLLRSFWPLASCVHGRAEKFVFGRRSNSILYANGTEPTIYGRKRAKKKIDPIAQLACSFYFSLFRPPWSCRALHGSEYLMPGSRVKKFPVILSRTYMANLCHHLMPRGPLAVQG